MIQDWCATFDNIYYNYIYIKQYVYNIKSTICQFDSAEVHIFHLAWALQTSHFYCYVADPVWSRIDTYIHKKFAQVVGCRVDYPHNVIEKAQSIFTLSWCFETGSKGGYHVLPSDWLHPPPEIQPSLSFKIALASCGFFYDKCSNIDCNDCTHIDMMPVFTRLKKLKNIESFDSSTQLTYDPLRLSMSRYAINLVYT